MSRKKTAGALRKYKRFLVTAHTNLEGDALGSELAFGILARKLGKEAVIVNQDGIPYGYGFLPGINQVRSYAAVKKGLSFDCFAVLDCSDIYRTGEVYRLRTDDTPVVNIDHHVSNKRFGDINWVEPHAASCCAMIYELYKEMRVPLDKESAVCVYTGVMTDTGSFRYSNTDRRSHEIAADLLRYDIDAAQVYRAIYGSIPYADMRVLTRILPMMRREAGGRIVWFQIPRRLLAGRRLSFDLAESILSFARSIRGVEVAALFKEIPDSRDEIRINLRSQGAPDMNAVASAFGGGGHRTASGATVHGKLDEVRRRVLKRIKESL